jgi:peptidoglycan/xylan/chitin deacetylase (PgdA/CDA1 family)
MGSGRSSRRRLLALAALLSLSRAVPQPAAADGPTALERALAGLPDDYVGYVEIPRYFPQTRHNVDGAFLAYFRANGGIDTFGYPLTEEFWEPDGPDEPPPAPAPDAPEGRKGGAGKMVQYFQRARLEYPLDAGVVRRSPLGEALGKQQPAVPPLPGLRYFPETGHNVGNAFLRFFVDAGGVEALGLPLSEEVEEHGRTVQWFQHARLEWWPEHPAGRRVQYGLIGEEHLRQVATTVPAAALRPAAPLAPLREWVLPPPPPPPAARIAPLEVPVLYYHQVPAPEALRRQVQAFKEAGRTIIPLGQLVDALRAEGRLPEQPLVLTFDDGWASQFANALPVLQAEQIRATFFVITRYLGTLPGYMTWDQVRVLKELGHEVESHTQNHADVVDLAARDEGAALAEIWESLAVLESRLGRSRRLFAYPNGSWSPAVAAVVARVYRGAAATGGGTLQSQDRLYALRRIKAEPAYEPERLLKQLARAGNQ